VIAAIPRKPSESPDPNDAQATLAASSAQPNAASKQPGDGPGPALAPVKSEEIPTVDELQDVASMADEDLMKLCQDGDEAAFEVLFQRYEGPALSFIQRMIGDRNRTEALGQEAFLRIFKDAKGYQYPRSFTTWFYTIVRNLCKNELRWRSRHPTVSIEENVSAGERSSSDGARIENLVNQEMNQKLEEALKSLPELEREILILSRFQNLKYKEISEIVGVPVSTVRARIYWTLDHLRKSIKDYL